MKFTSKRLHIIGLTLLAALVLGACSMVRLAYNQADSALYWWLDGYFDFNESQTLRLRADLSSALVWHRSTQLPAYLAQLQQLRALASAPTTGQPPGQAQPPVRAEQICALYSQGQNWVQALSERMEPTILALAPTFSAAQLQRLEQRMNERRQRFVSEWLSGTPEQRQERRVKVAIERAERFYGRLDEAQLALIRRQISASSFDPQYSLSLMQRNQQDALSALRLLSRDPVANPVLTRTVMRSLLARWLSPSEANELAYRNRSVQDGCAAIATLHNSTSAAQRERAVQVLKDYEADLRALMGEPAAQRVLQ